MTRFRWLRGAATMFATTAIAFGVDGGFTALSARAAPDNGSHVCNHLIGIRNAYYDLYLRAKNDESLLVSVARYTWDATDTGCFGTEAALRQRAFAPSAQAFALS